MSTAPRFPPECLNTGRTSINRRASFRAFLNGMLPAPNESFSNLIGDWKSRLKPPCTDQALRNATGAWYEWLIAISAWNYRVNVNNALLLAVKLPSMPFDASSLYNPELYAFIIQLRETVRQAGNVSLHSSNPDFVLIDHRSMTLPDIFQQPIVDSRETTLQMLDTAHQNFIGRCEFGQIAGYMSVKMSLAPDRRYLVAHEASVRKALYIHLQTRQWIPGAPGIRYHAITADLRQSHLRALRTVATHSILTVHSRPESVVDEVRQINSFLEGDAVWPDILHA